MIAPQDDMRITREAADWFMELQTQGAACHAQFAQWLRRSPQHVEEFLAITGVSQKLDGLDPQRRIDVRALLKEETPNVVALPLHGPDPATPARRNGNKTAWLAAAAVTAAVIATWQWMAPSAENYVTGIGEQRAVKLPDGSLIQLNTQSRVQVRFTGKVREVRLLTGEALFSVERDPARPFQVLSGGTTVQVLGTQFNVYRSPAGDTTVSVVEGAVQVIHDSAAPTRLEAGEQADVRGRAVDKHAVPDVQNVTAWRQRQLIFRNKPLSQVVAEFNRYNTVQFEVAAQAGEELLSGVFAADRPESFVLFLEKDRSIRVERQGERLIIRNRPSAP